MKVEKPCSPGHSLKMLNDNMRTDILKSVHQHIYRQKEKPNQKSPLVMLIKSIEHTLGTFEHINIFECVEPNPFNVESDHPFDPEPDYRHDIKLLKSQGRALKTILKGLGD